MEIKRTLRAEVMRQVEEYLEILAPQGISKVLLISRFAESVPPGAELVHSFSAPKGPLGVLLWSP